ncbi:hypothetical protein DIPPA_02618 [Diplonema papillatum]|nr:hypothetical protein DIPPA_02618 [Diplonema papillatum]
MSDAEDYVSAYKGCPAATATDVAVARAEAFLAREKKLRDELIAQQNQLRTANEHEALRQDFYNKLYAQNPYDASNHVAAAVTREQEDNQNNSLSAYINWLESVYYKNYRLVD